MLQDLERRMSATISGWDCPLLFIYAGFDCGSGGSVAEKKISEAQRSAASFLGVLKLDACVPWNVTRKSREESKWFNFFWRMSWHTSGP